MSLDICFFPADLSGAGMLRCLLPGQQLQHQFGHSCFTSEIVKDSPTNYQFNLGKIPQADIYVFHQRKEPQMPDIISRLQGRGSIVVCDTDDNYLHLPINHPARKALTQNDINRIHEIYRMADALTVSTPYLQDQYEGYNANTVLLPNYLDAEMWDDLERDAWENIRIGWQGESRLRMWDLQVLQGIIEPFLKKHPEVDFVAAGDEKVHDILNIPEAQRVSYKKRYWRGTPLVTNTMDIGLVPLELNPFNEGKSNLKGQEYNACGIPYIASPTSSYVDWTEDGKNGFLARRPRDWHRYLELLLSDAKLRKQMGSYGRTKALNNSIQRNAYKWNDLYTSLAGDWADQLTRTAVQRGALQKPPELSAFLRHIKPLNLKTVVEIGTARGGTFGALSAVAAPDAVLVSVDYPGPDDRLWTGIEDNRYGEKEPKRIATYVQESQVPYFIQGDSHTEEVKSLLAETLAERKADLLFIDGDHSYEGVKQDYYDYRGFVKDGGLICFHDIVQHGDKTDCFVRQLWNEVKDGKEWKEFAVTTGGRYDWGWGDWGGIGVLVHQGD